jgi:hypothetical protein
MRATNIWGMTFMKTSWTIDEIVAGNFTTALENGYDIREWSPEDIAGDMLACGALEVGDNEHDFDTVVEAVRTYLQK